MKKLIIIFLVILILTVMSYYEFQQIFLEKQTIKGEFVINKGDSINKIANNLTVNGFIKHPLIFKVGVRVFKQSKNIKAGYYTFKGKLTVEELISQLTLGSSKLIKITFPEGLTGFEIFNKLVENGFGNKDVYIDYFYHPIPFLPKSFEKAETLEGFLFPETYFFKEKATEKEILIQMIKEFFEKFNSINKPKELGLTSYQSLILASLVEKETNGKDEEKIIASVFLNRLNKKMRLQCDPTIIYALILEGNYDGNIRKKDITMENRFNTYYISGLPPTPISNPGFKALDSVFNPEKTNYLYFVSNNEGKHLFSETYKEHLVNVEKFQIKYWRNKKWQKQKQ